MRHYTAFISLLIINSFAILPSLAQTKQLSEVSVDLGSGATTGALGLPFDVPFRFKGNTTPSFRKISLTYNVSDSYTGDPNELEWKGSTKPSTWSYVGDQQEWRLPVGPIHPNVEYNFIFTLTRIPDVKAPEKEKFKQEAYRILEAFYAKPGDINNQKITETNRELNRHLTALVPPGQKIKESDGITDYTVDINVPPFSTLLQTLKDVKFKQMSMETDLKSLQNIFTLPEHKYDDFRLRLINIIDNPSLLAPASKAIIDGVIDAGNAKYKDVKMIDIGNLAKQPGHRINEVFEGKLTLDRSSWAAVQRSDIDLMQLVYQFYYKLVDNLDKKAGGKTFTNEDISLIKNGLLVLFKNIIATQVFNSQLTELKNTTLDKFPDVLADKLLSATYIVNDQSYIDAVSQATPYIGLDVGFSYIPGYKQLFLYEGVNIYFMPVNKDAPLCYFKKPKYWILKRLSIHLGLTQSLIRVENQRYEPLIKDIGSLLAGAGLRINRIIRLNAGYMFFYEKDNNPLVDKKHFTALPQFSLTFDINIGRALGGFGTRLKLNQ